MENQDKLETVQDNTPAEELVVIDNLLEGWMEIYERSIFNGKTLNEMIDLN